MINLMLPTRGRVDKCYTFCKSAIDTAHDVNNFFISLVTDEDDPTVPELKEKLKDLPSIKWLPQEKVDKFPGLVYYWDRIIEQTKDECTIFGMVGDDMVYTPSSKNWDRVTLDHFAKIPDDLGLLFFNANHPQGRNLCVNSFVHKRYVELTGMYVDRGLKADYTDDFLHRTFKGINRLYYVENMVIAHMHPDYKAYGRQAYDYDATNTRRRAVDAEQYNGKSLPLYFQQEVIPRINKNIETLKGHMK